MNDIQKISDEIKKQLKAINNETLQTVYRDHSIAVEYIKKGTKTTQINLSDEEIDKLASEMQSVALMLLKEREIKLV
ncbi:hypothetical protein M1349_02660 [Patescibacteria group bacterium]|nr:hypothetical protein [Patescibacteria group bacterium]